MYSDENDIPLGITPLMVAADTQGSGNQIRQLLSGGADVNARDKNGQTALMYTTFKDNAEAAKVLLSSPGIDLEAKDLTGSTALMKAVAYKSKSVCALLIEAGSDVNTSNYFGETALIRSIKNSDNEIIELLLKSGADVNHVDNIGRTPLIVAAGYNDSNTVQHLINAGADIKMCDKSGNDVARAAAEKDSWEVLAFLMNFNHISDKDIEAALIKASMKGFVDSTSTILALCKDNKRLSYAALVSASLKDKPEIVRMCMKFSCDINGRIYFGMTPLMIACYCNSVQVATLLVTQGADLNATDEDGFTALMYAAMKNTPNIIYLLIGSGADKNIQNKEGKTFEEYTKDFDMRTFSQMIADRMRAKHPELLQERPDDIPECHQSFGERFDFYRQKYFERYPKNKNSDIYRGAGMTRQTFSKIISNRTPGFRPKKDTAVALAIGLKLTTNECEDFLQCAGYTFHSTDRKDMEARKLFCEENYNLFDWNDKMYAITGELFFKTLAEED